MADLLRDEGDTSGRVGFHEDIRPMTTVNEIGEELARHGAAPKPRGSESADNIEIGMVWNRANNGRAVVRKRHRTRPGALDRQSF